MIQLFFKISAIKPHEWASVYKKIEAITEAFPLQLKRIESIDFWNPDNSSDLEIEYSDLYRNKGTDDENISFYGDTQSYTAGNTVCFFKLFEKNLEKNFYGSEKDTLKPITWYPSQAFHDDGTLPNANGKHIGSYAIDTNGAIYKYAILAIGIMLENELPGRVFMIALEQEQQDITQTLNWLNFQLNEHYEIPIYFDKVRLLDSFIDSCESKKHAVERMENLFRKQFYQNMVFAIENIGYQAAFEFYSEVLATYTFGTFGFSDVLDAWIAATKDLESVLNIVDASKRFLANNNPTEYQQQKIEKYKLDNLLEKLLNDFILWTPQMREELEKLYTNKRAIETGNEDLMGSIFRMSGYRVDICPISTNKEILFEAFMYFDPKNGNKYKEIIDNWIENNHDKFSKLTESLNKFENNIQSNIVNKSTDNEILDNKIDIYTSQYPEHSRFIVEKAAKINTALLNMDVIINKLHEVLSSIISKDENKKAIQNIQSESKDTIIKNIYYYLIEKRLPVSPNFIEWLNAENDKSVLFMLRLLVSTRIYDAGLGFIRLQIVQDCNLWEKWRSGGIYDLLH